MTAPFKSSRADGLGHWTPGKRRSTLTDAQGAAIRAKLERARSCSTLRALAALLGMDDGNLCRLMRGDSFPSERTAARVNAALGDM